MGLLCVLLTGCSDPVADPRGDVDKARTDVDLVPISAPVSSQDSWLSSLPANARELVWGDSVVARGCTFTVGTAMELPPYPPVYHAFVQRSGGAQCAIGFVMLGTSYTRPTTAIVTGQGAIVADYSYRATPSGSAHSWLSIVELSPATGAIERRVELGAMSSGMEYPQTGNVYDGALGLAPGGSLTVTGEKNGIIPGEIGSGDHYLAVYEQFLGPSTSPAPTWVVAW